MSAPPSKGRKRALFAVKCAISLALVWLVYSKVGDDLPQVMETLKSTSIPLLLLTFANHLAGRLLMAYQNGLGLRVYGVRYPLWRLFSINLQTMFYGTFLPGDFSGFAIKWYLLSRIEGRRSETLAAMIYIRIVYMIVVLLTGLVAILFHWPFESMIFLYVGLAVLTLLIGATLAIHLRIMRHALERAVDRATAIQILAPLRSPVTKLHDAINAFSQMKWPDILLLWGSCLLIKVSITFSFWILAHAAGIPFGFVALLWIQSVVEIVQFLPISFSGIGAREISVIYMLGMFGIDEPVALGFSLLIFALRIGLSAVGGILAGWSFLTDDLRKGAAA